MALTFPDIDPVALSIGPIDIRWYALSYMAGFLLGLYLIKKFLDKYPSPYLTRNMFDDLLTWVIIGVILGGRFGYVVFYNLDFYIENPLDAFKIWQGGMAFHGGLIGVITAMILFAWKHKIPFFVLSDRVAVVTPIGLFFGRIANFINGELYGRATDMPWGMIFRDGDVARHPSQVYQALTEGLFLFIILIIAQRYATIRNHFGALSGIFLSAYAFQRFFVEFTRQPDEQLGLLSLGLSMGQWLCLPMFMAGISIIIYSIKFNRHPEFISGSKPK
jgi:phosphatidylglycerol---prolipoprotein diacylglyceryl transferase